MITVTVTSDSDERELRAASRLIDDFLSFRADKDAERVELRGNNPTHVKIYADTANVSIKEAETALCNGGRVEIWGTFNENVSIFTPNGEEIHTTPIFNATELAEADRLSQDKAIYDNPNELGKPVCSTVDASQSTTAHVDTQVDTSLPEPTSVFGQPAQTTANEANRAVPLSELHAHDADGIKWDKRIHSSSKELNKDGTWRKRRGVDDALVAQVESELRGEHSAPVPQPKPPVDHSHEGETPVFTATIPTEMTFMELLDGVTKAMVAGQLSQAKITEALATIGLTALPNLLGNPALIPAFREALGGVV